MEANPEELTIRHHVDGDAFVIEVSGEIDLHTASELQRTVDRLSPFPHPVVLDLGGVGFIDSTGIPRRSWRSTTARPRRPASQ